MKVLLLKTMFFYRRSNDKQWQGPATVIGQENKQILVKHGGVYYRCHSCNLVKKNGKIFNNDVENNKIDAKVDIQDYEKDPPLRRIYIDDEDDKCDGQTSKVHELNTSINNSNNSSITPSKAPSVNGPNNSLVPSHDTSASDNDDKNHETSETDVNAEHVNENKNTKDVIHQQKSLLPTSKTRIAYIQNNNPCWKNATVLGRAGKVTGKNKYCLNILDDGDESGKCIDWRNVDDWKEIEENINFCSDADILKAKEKELSEWKAKDVYEPVPYNGQKVINSRWVLKEKHKPNGSQALRARLVARGFEEDSSSMQTDSPTCGSESLRTVFVIAASNKWKGSSIDIKAAFLQGAYLERDVFLRPPPEAHSDEEIWHLKKCVYGLNDASRYWYMRVRQELFKLNMKSSKYDKAIFNWYDQGELSGIITSHVDDFFWCGTESFKSNVIDNLRDIFEFGEEHSDFFKYIGLYIQQQENGKIILNQNEEIEQLEIPLISRERLSDKNSPLNTEEIKTLRSVCGKLNWIASKSRPDLSFDVCDLSCSIKNAKISDLQKAAKVVRKAKSSRVSIKFPSLDLSTIKVIIYSDASYGNLPDGSSQGGHIIFLSDSSGKCVPITWSSVKIKRIARSTLAAECMALQDSTDAAILISSLLSEMLYEGKKQIKIIAKTDSKGLHSALYSTKAVQDKRLRVDIASLREMLERRELDQVCWIQSSDQLADCLTKKTASSEALLNTLHFSVLK